MWPPAPGTLVSRAFSFSATLLQILVTWWISELRKRFWVRYASMSSWKKHKVGQQWYHKQSTQETSSPDWSSRWLLSLNHCDLLFFLICERTDVHLPLGSCERAWLAGSIR